MLLKVCGFSLVVFRIVVKGCSSHPRLYQVTIRIFPDRFRIKFWPKTAFECMIFGRFDSTFAWMVNSEGKNLYHAAAFSDKQFWDLPQIVLVFSRAEIFVLFRLAGSSSLLCETDIAFWWCILSGQRNYTQEQPSSWSSAARIYLRTKRGKNEKCNNFIFLSETVFRVPRRCKLVSHLSQFSSLKNDFTRFKNRRRDIFLIIISTLVCVTGSKTW